MVTTTKHAEVSHAHRHGHRRHAQPTYRRPTSRVRGARCQKVRGHGRFHTSGAIGLRMKAQAPCSWGLHLVWSRSWLPSTAHIVRPRAPKSSLLCRCPRWGSTREASGIRNCVAGLAFNSPRAASAHPVCRAPTATSFRTLRWPSQASWHIKPSSPPRIRSSLRPSSPSSARRLPRKDSSPSSRISSTSSKPKSRSHAPKASL